MVDLTNAEVTALLPLGFKHFDASVATLDAYDIADRPCWSNDRRPGNLVGGFSGLFYEGTDGSGRLLRHAHRPRAESGTEDVDDDGVNERPFALPDFQPVIVRLAVDPATGAVEIVEQIGLTRADGTPLTGLPNLAGEGRMAYADEEPVDLTGDPLELDPLGADLEGIVRAEDGTYWMVDEYRPAIYHFMADGTLAARYVPEGSNSVETGVAVGEEAIPAIYAQRHANRGFEAVPSGRHPLRLYPKPHRQPGLGEGQQFQSGYVGAHPGLRHDGGAARGRVLLPARRRGRGQDRRCGRDA